MVRQRRSDSVMLHDSDQTVLCVSFWWRFGGITKRTPGSLKLNIKVRGRDKSSRPRPKGPETEAEARGYEAEAKILASMPVWPRDFNISEL